MEKLSPHDFAGRHYTRCETHFGSKTSARSMKQLYNLHVYVKIRKFTAQTITDCPQMLVLTVFTESRSRRMFSKYPVCTIMLCHHSSSCLNYVPPGRACRGCALDSHKAPDTSGRSASFECASAIQIELENCYRL